MEAPPSSGERAYAAVVGLAVPVVIGIVLFSSYVKGGVVDTASMKTDAMYYLAYIGTIAIALLVGRTFPRSLMWAIKNELFHSLIRVGVPPFLLTTCFNWVFPSHIGFTEHIVLNLILALLMSFAFRPERAIEVQST